MRPVALALVAALVACRRQPLPRDASQATARDGVAAPIVRSALLDVRGLTPWADVAPGLQWRRAEVRVRAVTPAIERASEPPAVLQWVVVRARIDRVELTVERSPDDSIATLWERDATALAVLDGAYFEPDHSPSGLVISSGRQVAPVGLRGGSGVLRVAGGLVDIVPLDARDGGTFTPSPEVSLALQCGPRIIEQGGLAGIHRHDGRYAARTVACVRDGGRTLDLIATWDGDDPRRGPELHDLATILSGPSPTGDAQPCDAALNLDGGPSTGVYVRASPPAEPLRHAPEGPTPWALVVRARR